MGQNLAIFQVWSQKINFPTKRNPKFNPNNADNDNDGILQSAFGLILTKTVRSVTNSDRQIVKQDNVSDDIYVCLSFSKNK